MVHVVETSNGVVMQVITFLDTPGLPAIDSATNLAKNICKANGILFEGNVSCDGTVSNYSVQIVG